MIPGIVFTLGKAGGVEHRKPHDQRQQHQDQKGIVHTWHRPQGATVLFGMHCCCHTCSLSPPPANAGVKIDQPIFPEMLNQARMHISADTAAKVSTIFSSFQPHISK